MRKWLPHLMTAIGAVSAAILVSNSDLKKIRAEKDADLIKMERQRKSDLDVMEKKHSVDLEKMKEDILGQSKLYEEKTQTDLIREMMQNPEKLKGVLNLSNDLESFNKK